MLAENGEERTSRNGEERELQGMDPQASGGDHRLSQNLRPAAQSVAGSAYPFPVYKDNAISNFSRESVILCHWIEEG